MRRPYLVLAVIFFTLAVLCAALAVAYFSMNYPVLAVIWTLCAGVDAATGVIYARLDKSIRMR